MSDGFDLKATDEQIVQRVLDEAGLSGEGLDAERVLVELLRVTCARHVDCELRKMGRRDAWKPGNERMNTMVALMDAIHAAGGPNPKDPADAEPAEVRRALWQMLAWAQFAAERKANIIGDDGEEKPIMRLVTD
jgi:hypothetical protein